MNKLEYFTEERETYSFLHDIIKYTLQRLEFEYLKNDNEYFLKVGLKSIIITIISSLTMNLFKEAILEVTAAQESKMINDLMDKIKSAVVLGVMSKGENENEQ